jgi:hypothetical protein
MEEIPENRRYIKGIWIFASKHSAIFELGLLMMIAEEGLTRSCKITAYKL